MLKIFGVSEKTKHNGNPVFPWTLSIAETFSIFLKTIRPVCGTPNFYGDSNLFGLFVEFL